MASNTLRALIASAALLGAGLAGPAFASDEPVGPQFERTNVSAGSYLEVGNPSLGQESVAVMHDGDALTSTTTTDMQNVSLGSFMEAGNVSLGAALEK